MEKKNSFYVTKLDAGFILDSEGTTKAFTDNDALKKQICVNIYAFVDGLKKSDNECRIEISFEKNLPKSV